MSNRFHLLETHIQAPLLFTYPFNYTPHPLAELAAGRLKLYVQQHAEWKDEVERGKMFGVLVVRDSEQRLGYLAAYSGLLAGRNDWEYFVPSVYDSMQPDGYFKIHERQISALNAEIHRLEACQTYIEAVNRLHAVEQKAKQQITAFKEQMKHSKQQRDAVRSSSISLTPEENAAMIRQSQFEKAELRRLKQRCADATASAKAACDKYYTVITQKKQLRKQMSDHLQQWLFQQYDMLNARGEHRNLCDIFADTPQHVPPSGAGDCCAPKLLQYAYSNDLHPVCMAEFWWGRSPKAEVRHHFHYYPACRSKCKPILGFMLQGLNVEANPHDCNSSAYSSELKIIYQDAHIIVVSKPSGMLSMPGLVSRLSVIDVLRRKYSVKGYLMPAHRLDMDTSGLLIVTRTEIVLRNLHEQFANRRVVKRYVAMLDGISQIPAQGFVRLPLLADENDRPRQVVDHERGKAAITEYEIERVSNGKTLIRLYPHTGRTHQLRVHCAHADGLALPIVGDSLYGHRSESRLMLHAEYIAFSHPVTGAKMQFTDKIW